MKPILLQCAVSGFGAQPVTLYGALDPGTGALNVGKEGPHTSDRKDPQFAFVSNSASAEGREMLFADEHLSDAIEQYFDLKSRGLLVLGDKVTKHTPDNGIEHDGLDESGRKYRLHPDMSNGQVAVLVLAWFARRQMQVTGTLEAFDEIMDVYSAVSIGLPGEPDDDEY